MLAIISLLVLASTFPLQGAFASSYVKSSINYQVEERTLEKVAEDLAAAIGMPVVFTQKAPGTVRNWSVSGSPTKVVAQFSTRFGFLFNFDGRRYELTPFSATVKKTIKVSSGDQDSIRRLVSRVYKSYSDGSIILHHREGLVTITGSERFVSSVESLLTLSRSENVTLFKYDRWYETGEGGQNR